MKLRINENNILNEERQKVASLSEKEYEKLISKVSGSDMNGTKSPIYQNLLDWAGNNEDTDMFDDMSQEEWDAMDAFLNEEED